MHVNVVPEYHTMIQEGAHVSLRMNITVTLKKKKMFCAEYKHDCEIVKSTMTFHDPLILNNTHTLLFIKNPTIIKNDLFIEKLDLLTNYIVSFNLNTTFFINNMEYDADGFDQKEQIKLTKLMMMEKHS